MRPAARLGVFLVAALGAFGAGAALGAAFGPLDPADPAPSHEIDRTRDHGPAHAPGSTHDGGRR